MKLPHSNVALLPTGQPKRGDLVLQQLRNHSRLKYPFFKRIVGLPGDTIELQENRVIVNSRAIPVRALNPADFAWVPKTYPIGSVVPDEDGHWITFTPGESEHRNHLPVR